MSWIDSLFTSSNAQTQDEAAANIAKLQAQANVFNNQKLANGTITQAQHDQAAAAIAGDAYTSPGTAAVSSFVNSVTFGAFGTPDPNAAEANPNGTGFSNVVKDVLLLAAIGGAVWLFVKLGGINQIKKLAGL